MQYVDIFLCISDLHYIHCSSATRHLIGTSPVGDVKGTSVAFCSTNLHPNRTSIERDIRINTQPILGSRELIRARPPR